MNVKVYGPEEFDEIACINFEVCPGFTIRKKIRV